MVQNFEKLEGWSWEDFRAQTTQEGVIKSHRENIPTTDDK